MKRKPILFCFCGPTASGKSTICQKLLTLDTTLKLSVSTTTRPPREGEIDGVHYFFVTKDEFAKRVARGEFIEHATFNDNFYGTEKKNIDSALNAGQDLLLDIEVQGVSQLKKIYTSTVVTVFVFPVSFEELRNRLEKRGTETIDSIKKRLVIAKKEVETLCSKDFSDYLLVNDTLNESIAYARAIILAERQRFFRQAFSSHSNS